MNALEHVCTECKLSQLAPISKYQAIWLQWQTAQQPLFSTVLEAKPETAPKLHLLGILTKSHIELISIVTSYADAINQMQAAIGDTVGKEHIDKFKTSHVDELCVITHAWLYVQGYLDMDFSLADDHAYETARLINSVTPKDTQQLRTQYLESFYCGKTSSKDPKKTRISEWMKSLFK